MYGVGSSPFEFILWMILAVVLVATWVILAGSRFLQGGTVERPERVPQLYGYTALLIALIMGTSAVYGLVENALVLSDPAHGRSEEWGGGWEPSVTSFEAFRATYDRSREMRLGPDAPPPDPLPEAELRRRYEALRADVTQRTAVQARRGLVLDSLLLVMAVALFAFHWRWLRRRVGPMGTTPAAVVPERA